jgi:N-methylhydantoinase B
VSIESAERDYGVVIRGGAVAEADTTARRNRPAQANVAHTYGPERTAWERLFRPDMLDRLNSALFRLPSARRTPKRTEIYTAILQALPPSFPIGMNVDCLSAEDHERLLAAVEQLENELDAREKLRAG